MLTSTMPSGEHFQHSKHTLLFAVPAFTTIQTDAVAYVGTRHPSHRVARNYIYAGLVNAHNLIEF